MLVLVLAFLFVFISCDNGTKNNDGNLDSGGGGTLTVINIPAKYNGKYAFFRQVFPPVHFLKW